MARAPDAPVGRARALDRRALARRGAGPRWRSSCRSSSSAPCTRRTRSTATSPCTSGRSRPSRRARCSPAAAARRSSSSPGSAGSATGCSSPSTRSAGRWCSSRSTSCSGAPPGAIAFGTALAVVGTYAFAREITRDRATALVAASVLVLSPFVVIQSGVYLGYLFSLGLGSLFGACFLAGLRRRSAWLLVLAGALVGWLFMTRPFDGLLWGVALVGLRHGRVPPRAPRLRRPARRGPRSGSSRCSSPRSPTTVTSPAASPSSRSPRPTRATRSATACAASGCTGRRSSSPPGWASGRWRATAGSCCRSCSATTSRSRSSSPGCGSAAATARRSRCSRSRVVFPLGYATFWGISLSASFARVSGPIYFVPLLLPVSVLVAVAIVAAWQAVARVDARARGRDGGGHRAVPGRSHRPQPHGERVTGAVARRHRPRSTAARS